jgi:hypothetical protein
MTNRWWEEFDETPFLPEGAVLLDQSSALNLISRFTGAMNDNTITNASIPGILVSRLTEGGFIRYHYLHVYYCESNEDAFQSYLRYARQFQNSDLLLDYTDRYIIVFKRTVYDFCEVPVSILESFRHFDPSSPAINLFVHSYVNRVLLVKVQRFVKKWLTCRKQKRAHGALMLAFPRLPWNVRSNIVSFTA